MAFIALFHEKCKKSNHAFLSQRNYHRAAMVVKGFNLK